MNEQAIQLTTESEGNQTAALAVWGRDFELAQRMAKSLASSSMVPDRFRNDIGSCLIALDMATRLGFSPVAVMQQMYVVHGQPAFEGKFMIACVNQCGKYSPLRFACNDKKGDDYGYYAVAKELDSGEVLTGTTIDLRMVKAEGWNNDKKTRTGGIQRSKWNTMEEQMFKYRAAAFWVREYDPGLIMGMPTQDEVIDVGESSVVRDDAPGGVQTLDDVTAANLDKQDMSAFMNEDLGEPFEAGSTEIETRKAAILEMANQWKGDDAMLEIAAIARSRKPRGFYFTSATVEDLDWLAKEIDDRMDAESADRG